ncbi:MAG TPA: phenylacetate--CoA ligase family protein [Gemmataceae bacterium]|nr:phenylacetate--CoA ligase family protein [Gemmataceae bacterium]
MHGTRTAAAADPWAPVVRAFVAPLWARWERSPYLRRYRTLLQTQFDPPEVVRARQWQAVAALLRHAYDTAPFWRERLDRAGLPPDRVRSWDDFRSLPVLTKHDLRARRDDLVSRLYDPATLHRKKTSGSTGVSLEILIDEDSLQWKRACTLRADEWSGWRLGERVAMVWGNPDYLRHGWRGRLRNRLLERRRYLDTLKMDEAALARFAESLRQTPASLLFGHAHSVYLFAEYVGRTGGGVRPRGIITSAMVLHDWQRHVIEEVFGCRVTNRYGCEEVSLIACECERHEGLHVNADGVFVEVLRDGRPARPGEAGSVVVTDLTNRAMPLLRYQVGDVAVLADRRCPCGRGLPLLERLEGREADYVLTPRGELISGISLTENFALHVPGVAQLQIVQEELAHFRFRVVRGPDFGPHSLARLGDLVAERFGPDVTHECEYVECIPPEPSGKYRFCISRVANPFTRTAEAALS